MFYFIVKKLRSEEVLLYIIYVVYLNNGYIRNLGFYFAVVFIEFFFVFSRRLGRVYNFFCKVLVFRNTSWFLDCFVIIFFREGY